jgi:hypothetical protein
LEVFWQGLAKKKKLKNFREQQKPDWNGSNRARLSVLCVLWCRYIKRQAAQGTARSERLDSGSSCTFAWEDRRL